MAFPIIPESSDLTSPAPILCTPKYDSNKREGPEARECENIFPSRFCLIHDTTVFPGVNGGHDTVFGVRGSCTFITRMMNGSAILSVPDWLCLTIIPTGVPDQLTSAVYTTIQSAILQRAKLVSWLLLFSILTLFFHPSSSLRPLNIFNRSDRSDAEMFRPPTEVLTKMEPPKGPESLKDISLWRRIVLKDFGLLNDQHTGT